MEWFKDPEGTECPLSHVQPKSNSGCCKNLRNAPERRWADTINGVPSTELVVDPLAPKPANLQDPTSGTQLMPGVCFPQPSPRQDRV